MWTSEFKERTSEWMKAQKLPTLAANLIALRFKRSNEQGRKNQHCAMAKNVTLQMNTWLQFASFLFICLFWCSVFGLTAVYHWHVWPRLCRACITVAAAAAYCRISHYKCDIWITNFGHFDRHKQTNRFFFFPFFFFPFSRRILSRAKRTNKRKHIPTSQNLVFVQ